MSKALSIDELQVQFGQLQELQDSPEDKRLTEWETKFLADMLRKFKNDQRFLHFTDRQLEFAVKLYKKYCGGRHQYADPPMEKPQTMKDPGLLDEKENNSAQNTWRPA